MWTKEKERWICQYYIGAHQELLSSSSSSWWEIRAWHRAAASVSGSFISPRGHPELKANWGHLSQRQIIWRLNIPLALVVVTEIFCSIFHSGFLIFFVVSSDICTFIIGLWNSNEEKIKLFVWSGELISVRKLSGNLKFPKMGEWRCLNSESLHHALERFTRPVWKDKSVEIIGHFLISF